MNTDNLIVIAAVIMFVSVMALSRCQLSVRVVDSEAVDCMPTLNGEAPDE